MRRCVADAVGRVHHQRARTGYSPASYVALAVIGLLSSIGTAGVPGTAIVTATTVFTAVGLPVQLLVPLVPVSNIVGMPSTMANVSAAVTCAAIVSRQTGSSTRACWIRLVPGGIAIARAWSCRRLAGRLRLLSFLLRLPRRGGCCGVRRRLARRGWSRCGP
ncbi:MAG: cation:dicarboxylate symporter family transporter [Bifidobacterium bifidum]